MGDLWPGVSGGSNIVIGLLLSLILRSLACIVKSAECREGAYVLRWISIK